MKTQKLLPIIFLVVGMGCAGSNDSGGDENALQNNGDVFQDEASAQEKDLIAETMQSIKGYAAEFNVDTDLNRIPIVVTTRKELPKNVPSLCIRNGNVGAKIVLQKSFFTARVYDKDTGLASPLFNLLIHEIGHCYMNRNHESAVLKKKGYMAEFEIVSRKGKERVRYYSVQATMMHNTYFAMPKVLEKYYVGEIFGKYRAKTLEDLQQFYDFRIVPEQ